MSEGSEYQPPQPPLKNKDTLQVEEGLRPLVEAGILQPVPAVRVENTINYIRPGTNIGELDLKQGQPSNLVVQVALGELRRKADVLLYCRPGHNRTGIITANSPVIIDGQPYEILEEKAVGFIPTYRRRERAEQIDKNRLQYFVKPTPNKTPSAELDTRGSLSHISAQHDIKTARTFEHLGIRTIPLIAIARLEELINKDVEKITIEEARRLGLLSDQQPLTMLRGYITPFRPVDISTLNPINPWSSHKYLTEKEKQKQRAILMHAQQAIQNDLSIVPEIRSSLLDVDKYIEWFTKTLAAHVARMHGYGFAHNFLGLLHNITLDARIIDLDGVVPNAPQILINEEYSGLFTQFAPFYKDFLCHIPQLFNMPHINPERLLKLAQKTYKAEFKKTQTERLLKRLTELSS